MNGIRYIESLKDYIKIHTDDNKSILSKYKIGDIAKELKEMSFLRIHRSYIINTDKITAFTTNEIELSGIEIPIGTSYKSEIIVFLDAMK